MSREIKFRALDENGTWRIIDLTGSTGWAKELLSLISDGGSTFKFKTPLCQYTGLRDKNGNEIYEGDIVRDNGWQRDNVHVIRWNEESAQFLGDYRYGIFQSLQSRYEVIGNIHEEENSDRSEKGCSMTSLEIEKKKKGKGR